MDSEPRRSALLVMDVQRGVVDRYASDGALLERLRRAVDAARSVGMPVIFVRVAFRPGHPEVSSRNRSFAALASRAGASFVEGDQATLIHPALEVRLEDPVVVKKRVSAFAGSDLEFLLRSLGVTHLVLTGIATSGVVLSTLREAADRDYGLTVLSDGCADGDDEVHRVLTEKVFPRQAEVWRSGPAALLAGAAGRPPEDPSVVPASIRSLPSGRAAPSRLLPSGRFSMSVIHPPANMRPWQPSPPCAATSTGSAGCSTGSRPHR